ncbi:hypothetical protein AVEN_206241-1 [Araneus ventricosus]|uniref:DUF7041 domain-containing protein n=1 Tax=Araneus ventricosus TaxID=182803 RepID=A0A4Y2L805_ARAVE|nr:hypothetical protein AVEN_206241-1 [Araneus ventricosus]
MQHFSNHQPRSKLISPQFFKPKERRSNTRLAMRFCFGAFNGTCTKGAPLEEEEAFELDHILEKHVEMPNPDCTKLREGNNSSAGVSAAAIKTPAFWSDKPELWFAQLESQSALGNISVDSTKFHYVIAVLSSDDLTCVCDLNRPVLITSLKIG